MKLVKLKKCVTVLSGLAFMFVLFYLYNTRTQPQIREEQSYKTKKDEQQYNNNLKFTNIFETIKKYFVEGKSSDIGPDAVFSSNNYDVVDRNKGNRMPQPSTIPVTDNTEECLPYIKSLRVQLISDHDCDQSYVLMNHGGRLGNKLCQYISAYLLRHLYGVRVAIRNSMQRVLSDVIRNISLPVQEDGCFTNKTTRIKYKDVYMKLYTAAKEARDNATDKSLITASLLNKSYYVYQNPCPRALAMDHRDLLRTIVTFTDKVISLAIKKIDKAIKPYNATYYHRSFQVVSVHVRRTDYTGYIKKSYNLTSLDNTYFKRAFDFYRKRLNRPVFLVLSDDLAWCRKNLAALDVVIMDKGPANVDMATISLADHHITSYGTYSFIGALLGRGNIVHPIGHNRRYKVFDCVRSPYMHYISRDKTYETDNSYEKLV